MDSQDAQVVALDIGGVLISTVDDAHLRQLSELTGLGVERISDVLHASGLYDSFDAGRIGGTEMVEALRTRLPAPSLTQQDLTAAWNQMLGPANPQMCALAARLAAENRLVLATNSNPWHVEGVRARLNAAGLPAQVPILASYKINTGKPEAGYFRALREMIHPRTYLAFVDDREPNVEGSRRAGITAWHHRNARDTISYLTALAWPETQETP